MKSISTFILFLFGFTASSQHWTSVQDGPWNSPATWGTSNYPPKTLTGGKKVTILHEVSMQSSFTSTLSINSGATLEINGGTFLVGTGISIDNRGRFLGQNGSFLQCLYINCAGSGSQASGVWNNFDGGYTRMENMIIQIAQDWFMGNNGRRFLKNSCVKTGQNFSINHEGNFDTLISTRIELGLHASGNFQQNKGKVVYDNLDIDVAGSGGGNVQFSDGQVSGKIRSIRIRANNGNIQTSSSVSGFVDLDYYCIANNSNYQDPSNKIRNETRDCNMVASLLANPCTPGTPDPDPDPGGGGVIRRGGGEEPDETKAAVWPNPFRGQIVFSIDLPEAVIITARFYDMSGKEVYSRKLNGRRGNNVFSIQSSEMNLQPGMYIVILSDLNRVYLQKTMLNE
jgi:hypothetical protein